MMSRDEIIGFTKKVMGEELLVKAEVKDEMANGVQVWGKEKVTKVVLGVSLNEDLLLEAVGVGAEMVIVHHGFDVRTYKSLYSQAAQKRLKLIFQHELTIMGFHYALDAHPKIGNNAIIIRGLGASLGEPLFEDWGYTGVFGNPKSVEELSAECARLFEHDVFAVMAGPRMVTKIGVVSGAGKPGVMHMAELEKKGVELFITGEPAESVPNLMKESGINYFAGGHYATEVFGVQELGKVIKQEFKEAVEVEFIDIPNPI